MKTERALILLLGALIASVVWAQDPLPSWNDTFDNDGTLWCEQPIYFQVAFAFDRLRALAPQHSEKAKEPFRALLAGDYFSEMKSNETKNQEVKP
jgi:hypothetical protein